MLFFVDDLDHGLYKSLNHSDLIALVVAVAVVVAVVVVAVVVVAAVVAIAKNSATTLPG